jgi:hypothetical protein
MSLLVDIERIIKHNSCGWLVALEKYQATKIKFFHAVKNNFTTVYGVDSGEENVVHHGEFEAIVVNDDFFPIDPLSGGAFKEGWLFTNSTLIDVGDRVELDREDSRSRRYKIISKQSIGTTTSVFLKYRLSALGD